MGRLAQVPSTSCSETSNLLLESRLSTSISPRTATSKAMSQPRLTLPCSRLSPAPPRTLPKHSKDGAAYTSGASGAAAAADEDDDVDLFGSDEEEDDEEKKRITEERLAAYHAKKAKKPKVIAK